MRKVPIIFVFICGLCGGIFAAAGSTPVFDAGIGVKAQALGNAYIAGTDDSSAVFYNPSALYTLDRTEIQAAFIPLFLDTYYSYLAGGIPTANYGVFAFSAAMINTDNIQYRDSEGAPLGGESQNIMEFIAGWGREFFSRDFMLGLNIKFDRHVAGGFSDVGFGVDAGVLYRVINSKKDLVYAGGVIRNLIKPQFKLLSAAEQFPRYYKAGASYKRIFSPAMQLKTYMEIGLPDEADIEWGCGADFTVFDIFSLRAGYNSHNLFSIGAGVEIMRAGFMDYALVFSEIDTQNRFSIKLRFGESASEIRKNRKEKENRKIEKKAKQLAAKELSELREKIDELAGEARKIEYFKALHYTMGIEAYFDNDFDRAILEFETVGKADPEYMNTTYYISLIKSLKKGRKATYSSKVLKLYREGVSRYLAEDYSGAVEKWEEILEIDPYNKLAIDNIKEVKGLIRDIENIRE